MTTSMGAMRRAGLPLLHAGYWALWVTLVSVVFALASSGRAVAPNSWLFALCSWAGLSLIVPSVIGFYANFGRSRESPVDILPSLRDVVFTCAVAGSIGLAWVALVGLTSDFAQKTLAECMGLWAAVTFLALVHGGAGSLVRALESGRRSAMALAHVQRLRDATELELIRARLDPHFLFNSLNNIDTLIMFDPPRASQYLGRLAALLRFVVYDAREDRIALSAELQHLEQFVALHKLRLVESSDVRLRISGTVGGLWIAPMLLTPLVENAFKHAPARTPVMAHISVEIADCDLTLLVENACPPVATAYNGIGLASVRRRLGLSYPGRYELTTERRNRMFRTHLRIRLDHDKMPDS